MWRAAHGEDITEEQLLDYLFDWGLYDAENSFEDWIVWRRSNYVVLPYAGGWRDQPWWVRRDFLTLDFVRDYHDKQVSKPTLPDTIIDPFEKYD